MIKLIAYIFAASYIITMIILLWLESRHEADSLGLWYTVYGAFICSILLTIIVSLLIIGIRKLFLKKTN